MFKWLFGKRTNNVDPRDLAINRLTIANAKLEADLQETREERDYLAGCMEDLAAKQLRGVRGGYFGGQQ